MTKEQQIEHRLAMVADDLKVIRKFIANIRSQIATERAIRMQKPFRTATNGRIELHYCAN